MREEELFYLLALQSIEGIGAVNARKLIRRFGSAKKIFETAAEDLIVVSGIGTSQADRIGRSTTFKKAEEQLKFIHRNKIKALSLGDPQYSKLLKHCSDAPLLLFCKGHIALNEERVISMVGTRSMTPYGRDFINGFIEDLVPFDPLIVSGLAYGVDIHVHQQALKHGLQTIAVLAHGLDRTYPFIHQPIAERMLRRGGVLTEHWSGTNPDRENFIKRNRIIAGISSATIVVESAFKGGSLITADYAASYYRDVFAVPGRTTDRFSVGCNQLIKSHKAAAITSVKDLEYQLNWSPRKETEIQRSLFIELSENEKKLMDLLDRHGKMRLEALCREGQLGIGATSAGLLELELKGLVRALPGKLFEKV